MSVNVNIILVEQSKLEFLNHMVVHLTQNLVSVSRLTIGLLFGHNPLGNDIDSQGEC